MKTPFCIVMGCLLSGLLFASEDDSSIYIKDGASLIPSLEPGWSLSFYDNFDGNSLDTSKWERIGYEKGWSPSNTTWVYYQSQEESLVSVNGGCVKLEAEYGNYENQAKYQGSVAADANTYACGGIDTKNTFTFKHGYVEVKAAFTHQHGLWPAIWMMPLGGGAWPSSGEIDIMEHLANETKVYQTLHHVNTSGAQSSTGTTASINDVYGGADMHVYGMKWTEDYIEFYLDGERTAIMTRQGFEGRGMVWPFGEDGCEFYLIMDQQLTTVSSWQTNYRAVNESSLQTAIANDEAYMIVDYVKIFTFADAIPEPATSMLSMLALTGLVARRRRRN